MSNPSLKHYNYLDYLWGYILNTKDLGLDLTLKQSEIPKFLDLIGVSDSD
jgi:hypothetical protein